VAIDGHALRLRLRQGSVTKWSNDVNVRHGSHGSDRFRLISNGDRRRALDRDDFATLDTLGRALLRRAGEHGEEQRSEQRMQEERGEEARRQPFRVTAVSRIALEIHENA